MEWVIAALAVGCLFFALQVILDYVRYRSAIEPRIRQLEESREELKQRIEAARGELASRRDQLDPMREEIETLEREHQGIQRQIEAERSRQRSGSRFTPRAAPPPEDG